MIQRTTPGDALFVERLYDVEGKGQLRLAIIEPVPDEYGWWRSRLEIDWPAGRSTRLSATGFDRLDAMLTAVALARITLEASPDWLAGRIRLGEFDGHCLDLRVVDSAGPERDSRGPGVSS